MTILKGIYDSSNKRLMIDFSCSLLRDYYEIFENVTNKYKMSGSLPKGVEINKLEESRCVMVIPIVLPGVDKLGDGERIASGIIPKDLIEKISSVIEDFKASALEKELLTTEFIPLSGYPVKKLKEDIVEAIKNKRNFCIIDNYSNYEKFYNHETTKMNIYKAKYSSNDYSEIALSIYEGKLKDLKVEYLPKLEEIDWG